MVLVLLPGPSTGISSGEVKVLERELRPDRAALMTQIEAQPYSEELRRKLAFQYEREGFVAAARFFLRDPRRPLPSKPIKDGNVDGQGACPDDPASMSQVRLAASRISELTLESHHSAALSEVEGALNRFGPACPLLVQWADAVIHQAMGGKAAEAAQREAAVRLLITGADQLHILPAEYPASADVYAFLGKYFRERGDDWSSWAAIDLAVERLAAERPRDIPEITRWRTELEAQRDALASQLLRRIGSHTHQGNRHP
jgi:hypothetical protein